MLLINKTTSRKLEINPYPLDFASLEFNSVYDILFRNVVWFNAYVTINVNNRKTNVVFPNEACKAELKPIFGINPIARIANKLGQSLATNIHNNIDAKKMLIAE